MFNSIIDGSDIVLDNLHLGASAEQMKHVDGVKDILSKHRKIESEMYTNAATFKTLNEEMLEARMFALSKLQLWCGGHGTSHFLSTTEMRTCHRLMISEQRWALDNGFDENDEALELCKLKGLVRSSIDEINELGESRLTQVVAEDASPNALRLLIQAGANVNFAARDGSTAVFRAAQYGNTDCLSVLIEAGADLDAINHIGAPAIYVAAQNGHVACLKLLLDAKAKTDIQVKEGYSALHMAAREGDIECIEALLEAKATVNLTNQRMCTPLYFAAKHDRVNGLRQLLDAGADSGITCVDGTTALDAARTEGNEDCVEELEKRMRGGAVR